MVLWTHPHEATQSVEPFVQRSPFVSDTQIHRGTSVTTGCIVCYTQRRNPTPNNNKNKFVSSILRPLTMWHCLHLLLHTIAAERQSAINQCLLPAGPTAAECTERMGQTVSDSTLDTSLRDCVMTASSFGCKPSTDSSATSTGYI